MLDVQFYRGVADVDLAGHDVGDEAGAVLVREVDLAVGDFDGFFGVGSNPVKLLDQLGLYVWWWDHNREILEHRESEGVYR